MKITEILTYFDNVKKIGDKQYMAICPCHNDVKASLAITEEDNKILIHCFAGCDSNDILKSKGLTLKDLFTNEAEKNISKIDTEYIYTDEENRILYKTTRYIPKSFSQSQYMNGMWQNNMQNVRYVPYNLPNIINTDEVFFVEGEKDADNINRIGLVATTTIGGAQGFNKHKKEYSKYFKNKNVYIIPDNDKAGQDYASNVYNSISSIANRVKILDLKKYIPDLEEKQDISDVLNIYGKDKTLEILQSLIEQDSLLEFSGEILSKDLLEKILESLNIKIGYNEISKDVDIIGLPKEYSIESAETILPIFIKELMKKYRIKGSKKEIEDLLVMIFDSHRYNPIIDMFKNDKWDSIDRFNTLFEIMGIDDDFDKILIRKWFWQTVSISFNGYHSKPYGIAGVLTLQGPQNAGKTRFCRNIALKTEWFTEGASIDMKDKDKQILASKGWIVELGEVDATLKKKQADLKSFLSNTVDEIRVPYGRKSIKKPRRTSFVATVNPREFLIDETGNRRFWVVRVKSIDNEKLEKLGDKWIEQLWLQSYFEMKDNFQKFRLTNDEVNILNKRNHEFTELSPCEEEITLYMNFKDNIREQWTSTEINNTLLNGRYSSPIIGKAIIKIQNRFPDLVSIKTTNAGKIYTLPIKKVVIVEAKNKTVMY